MPSLVHHWEGGGGAPDRRSRYEGRVAVLIAYGLRGAVRPRVEPVVNKGPEGLSNELDPAGTNVPAGSNSSNQHLTSPAEQLLSCELATSPAAKGSARPQIWIWRRISVKKGVFREFSCFLLKTVRCGRAAPLGAVLVGPSYF